MPIPLPTVHLCDNCSKCCRSIGLPPFEVPNPDLGYMPRTNTVPRDEFVLWMLADQDIFATMPADLRAEHARLVSSIEYEWKDKPCAWLDQESNRCRHYDHRPTACREWQPGGDGCKAARRGSFVVWRDKEQPDDWWNPLLPIRDELGDHYTHAEWIERKAGFRWRDLIEPLKCAVIAFTLVAAWVALFGG